MKKICFRSRKQIFTQKETYSKSKGSKMSTHLLQRLLRCSYLAYANKPVGRLIK